MSHYVCRSPSMVHWHEEPPAAYTVLAHTHPLEPLPFSRYSLPLYGGTLPIRIAAGTSLRHTLSLNKPTLMPHSSLHSTQPLGAAKPRATAVTADGRQEEGRNGTRQLWRNETTVRVHTQIGHTLTMMCSRYKLVLPVPLTWISHTVYIKIKLGWNIHFSVELFFFLSKGVFPLCLQCTFDIFAPSLYIKNISIDPLSPNVGGRKITYTT